MVKFVSVFRIKPGFNPDESFQLWQDQHAPRVKKRLSGLMRKYVIARVLSAPEGNPDFFGMVEISFDDLDAAKAGVKKLLDAPPDEFLSRMEDFRRVFVVEEKDVGL